MKRVVIRVQKREGLPGWWVRVGGLELPEASQRNAVELALAAAKQHFRGGGRAQVVVHSANGQIRWERTYPDETPRRRG
jgi:hypothetical protein